VAEGVVAEGVVAVALGAAPARIRSRRRRSHLRHRPPGNRFRIPCWNWSRLRPRFRNPVRHQQGLQLPPRPECIPAPPASTSIQRPSTGPPVPSRKLLVFFARIPLGCVEPRPIRTIPTGVLPRTPGRDYDSNFESEAILIRYSCKPRPPSANGEPEISLRPSRDYGKTSEETRLHLPLSWSIGDYLGRFSTLCAGVNVGRSIKQADHNHPWVDAFLLQCRKSGTSLCSTVVV
jgi:hypothetical protein